MNRRAALVKLGAALAAAWAWSPLARLIAKPAVATEYVGIFADSRAVLIEYLNAVAPHMVSEWVWVSMTPSHLLVCRLPCGESRDYLTIADLPAAADECRCGRIPQRHYFIKYRQS